MQKVKYKGKIYRSVAVACYHLGITQRSVIRYTQKGLSVEQAIEQILKSKRRNSCTDHLGNEFDSLKSMALSYWLPPTVLYTRLKRKWDLKRALTTPIHHIGYTDHLGNKFKSIADMAEFYHISYRTFFYRLHRKWSIERVLTTIAKPRGKYASNIQREKI
jgi:hypothetical protein